MIYFPSVSIEEFDMDVDWLIQSMDEDKKTVRFEGQGKNAELVVVLDYRNNPDVFDTLSVGELVRLPKETFLVSETAPYRLDYECF